MSKWGNWTLYLDIPIPFTRRALILDIGVHPCLGWRFRTPSEDTE